MALLSPDRVGIVGTPLELYTLAHTTQAARVMTACQRKIGMGDEWQKNWSCFHLPHGKKGLDVDKWRQVCVRKNVSQTKECMDQPLHVLLDAACTQRDASRELIDALAAVQNVDVNEAEAWADQLRKEAASPQSDRRIQVMTLVGFVCLANAPLAMGLVDASLFDMLASLTNTSSNEIETCAMAHLLSEGASHTALRSKLATRPSIEHWLSAHAQISVTDERVQVCLDLMRIKFAIGTNKTQHALSLPFDTCKLMFDTFCAFLESASVYEKQELLSFDPAQAAIADALEGLFYLVSMPALRVALSERTRTLHVLALFLGASTKRKTLFPPRGSSNRDHSNSENLSPSDDASINRLSVYDDLDMQTISTGPTHAYVVTSILTTMTAYPPVLNAQDRQIDALRRSALKRANPHQEHGHSADAQEHSDAEHLAPTATAKRVRLLVEAGLLPSLVALAMAPSTASDSHLVPLRRQLQLLFLSLVTEQDAKFRGRLLQQGISRALLSLSQQVFARVTSSPTTVEADDLLPFQALAKLSISTNPALMYGLDGTSARAATYLAVLFLAPSSSLLQVFEAALALTNLSSMSPAMATLVAHTSYVPSEHKDVANAIVPMFLQFDSVMLRRALMELLCNLVQDESVYAHWSGEGDLENSRETDIKHNGDEQNGDLVVDDRSPTSAATLDAAESVRSSTLRLHTAHGRLQFLLTLLMVPTDAHETALVKAVAGLVAMLGASPVTCEQLVQMPHSKLRNVADLLESTELSPMDTHELAIRALTIVSCMTDYAQWLGPSARTDNIRRVLKETGLVAAVQHYLQRHLTSTARAQQDDVVNVQKHAVTLAVSILKTMAT